MASGSSDQDALSKLLQMSTVAEYQSEFEVLINRVTGISENLLKSFDISSLKPDLQCALLRSNPTTLGEAFSLARVTEARFKDQRSHSFNNKTSSNNSGLQNQNLTTSRFTVSRQEPVDEAVFVKVLVDGKQDDVKVVGVANEQNSDQPNVLEITGVIGVGVNENNKGVAKEVQYSIYALHVLIPLLKRLNNKYIKKRKMEVAIQRRLWDPEIKSAFEDNTLRARWF